MTSITQLDNARCRSMTPQECDVVFFPGSGGKPTKANAWCSQCPLLRACLFEAIELKLDGFFAGTTPDERKIMAEKFHTPVKSINEIVESNLPKSLGKRRVYRKIQPSNPDTLDFLNTLAGPVLV